MLADIIMAYSDLSRQNVSTYKEKWKTPFKKILNIVATM
jgi:hypothetical protein